MPAGAATPPQRKTFLQRVFRWWPVAPAPGPHAATHAHVPSELLAVAGLGAAQVLEKMQVTASGLSPAGVAARLSQYGPNQIAHEGERSVVVELLERFANPLNVLLLLLTGVSMVVGDRGAALLIFVMVILSVSLAFFQERRSSQAAAKLRAMVHTTATVWRRATEDEPPPAAAGADESDLPWTELPIQLLVRTSTYTRRAPPSMLCMACAPCHSVPLQCLRLLRRCQLPLRPMMDNSFFQPLTTSYFSSSTIRLSSGISSGLSCMSASMVMTTSPRAALNPSLSAADFP